MHFRNVLRQPAPQIGGYNKTKCSMWWDDIQALLSVWLYNQNLMLKFHFFVNFINSLQLCVKRYWFTFASHCNIWLLIEKYLYLNRLASQSKICSLLYTIIPFEVTVDYQYCHFQIGYWIYDCNDHNGLWTDRQLEFQTSYFI